MTPALLLFLDYVFKEGLKPPECLNILANCMKNTEMQIKEICEMNQVTQDNQIRRECQLRCFVKLIEFYNEKFDKLERDNKKKEEKVNELEKKTRKIDKKFMI